MPVPIDIYRNVVPKEEQEMVNRFTSGACLSCGGETPYEVSQEHEYADEKTKSSPLCNECIRGIVSGEIQPSAMLEKFMKKYQIMNQDPDPEVRWETPILDTLSWAQEQLEHRPGRTPLAPQEVLTDPRKIEEKYRQVGEDEWKWEREGPVGTRTMEKLYPGSIPKNIQDLGREHVPKPVPEYSDWLERKEPGGKKRPQDEETYLTPIEPAESQLSIRHKVAIEPMSIQQKREHEKQVEEFMEKQKREKTEYEKREDNEKARLRMKRLRDDRAIEEGEQEGLILKPGAMCSEHKDIPATFVLQTVGQFPGLGNRTPLCTYCASRLDIVEFPPSEGVTCVNVQYHAENPKASPIAMRALTHGKLFGENTGPIPLCKDCGSSTAIRVRPINEEGEKDKHKVPLAKKFDEDMEKEMERRKRRAYAIDRLMKLANLLDSRGLYAEANEIDTLIRQAGEWDKDYGSHLPPGEWKAETEGFMRDVETGERAPAFLDEMVCPDCGETMPLEVLKSGGGYYLGRTCKNCGPWGRDSGYFKSEKEAKKALEEYKNR